MAYVEVSASGNETFSGKLREKSATGITIDYKKPRSPSWLRRTIPWSQVVSCNISGKMATVSVLSSKVFLESAEGSIKPHKDSGGLLQQVEDKSSGTVLIFNPAMADIVEDIGRKDSKEKKSKKKR